MAVKPYTSSKVDALGRDTVSIFWDDLRQSTSDTGTPIELAGFADRSVQLLGALGTGGAVVLEGSNKKTPTVDADWHTLNDPQGNALSLNSLRTEQVLEFTRWVRPRVTAGDVNTILQLYLTAVQK
jgi:hypothetical protein